MYQYTPPRKPRAKPLASVFVDKRPLIVSPDGKWHSTGYWALRDTPIPNGLQTQEHAIQGMLLTYARQATQRLHAIGKLAWVSSGSCKTVPTVAFAVDGEPAEAIVVNKRYLDHCMSHFPRAQYYGSKRACPIVIVTRHISCSSATRCLFYRINNDRPRVVAFIMPLIWQDGTEMGEQVQTLLKASRGALAR